MNAVPMDGFAGLRDAFRDFEASDARVLIIAGAGGAFCAGPDLDPSGTTDLTSVTALH
jgi:enoyl-CoA hydratase